MTNDRDRSSMFYLRMQEKHGTKCRVCGLSPVEYHHLIPLSQGGTNDDGNIVPLCASCHKTVHGVRSLKKWSACSGKKSGRPIKRCDNWQEIVIAWACCKIGTAEAKRKLGVSLKTHLQDKKWIREYLKQNGLEFPHNTLDCSTWKHKK